MWRILDFFLSSIFQHGDEGWVDNKNVCIRSSPVQNCTDSGIPRFITPQPNIDVPLNDIAIKVHIYKNIRYKCKISSDFWYVCNILSFLSIIYVDQWD